MVVDVTACAAITQEAVRSWLWALGLGQLLVVQEPIRKTLASPLISLNRANHSRHIWGPTCGVVVGLTFTLGGCQCR